MSHNSLLLTRRKLILTASGGAILLGSGILGYTYINPDALKNEKIVHKSGVADNTDFDESILLTVAVFIGAYFGRALLKEHQEELVQRLKYAVRVDNCWREEYTWLASYIDSYANKHGASSFYSATPDTRELLINQITKHGAWNRRSRLIAIISEDEYNRLRMHQSTLPHLRRLYRNSGVPWQFRGYTHWPGMPGDWTKYTVPGPEQIC